MEIVSAADRIAHYEASLNGERIPANITNRKDSMIAGFSVYANTIVPMEITTKEICIEEVVANHKLPFYQAAMRAMWRAKINGGEPTVSIVMQVWIARGLSADILERIHLEVISPV